jgi:hypothetical protein
VTAWCDTSSPARGRLAPRRSDGSSGGSGAIDAEAEGMLTQPANSAGVWVPGAITPGSLTMRGIQPPTSWTIAFAGLGHAVFYTRVLSPARMAVNRLRSAPLGQTAGLRDHPVPPERVCRGSDGLRSDEPCSLSRGCVVARWCRKTRLRGAKGVPPTCPLMKSEFPFRSADAAPTE